AVKEQLDAALPNLTSGEVESVLNKFMSLGVDCPSDLDFLTEGDLAGILKPIQARKLVAHFKLQSKYNNVSDSKTPEQFGATSSEGSTSSKTSYHVDSTWANNFDVQWKEMPPRLQQALKENKRTLPKDRREMVRVIIKTSMEMCPRPLRKQLDTIAKKVVDQYPLSFKDVLDGTVVGTGHDSLLNQLLARVENVRREDTEKKAVPTHVNRKHRKECSYGCQSSSPGYTPEEELEMNRDKERLQALFREKSANTDEVLTLMRSTYPLQRRDINSEAMPMRELLCAWPFLFVPSGLFCHFSALCSFDIQDRLRESLQKKKDVVLELMRLDKRTEDEYTKVMEDIAKAGDDASPEAGCLALMLLLVTWFGEEKDCLILRKD
ncbi:unnamed protein product, partial [Ixodes persulcatus]